MLLIIIKPPSMVKGSMIITVINATYVSLIINILPYLCDEIKIFLI